MAKKNPVPSGITTITYHRTPDGREFGSLPEAVAHTEKLEKSEEITYIKETLKGCPVLVGFPPETFVRLAEWLVRNRDIIFPDDDDADGADDDEADEDEPGTVAAVLDEAVEKYGKKIEIDSTIDPAIDTEALYQAKLTPGKQSADVIREKKAQTQEMHYERYKDRFSQVLNVMKKRDNYKQGFSLVEMCKIGEDAGVFEQNQQNPTAQGSVLAQAMMRGGIVERRRAPRGSPFRYLHVLK